MAAVPDPDHAGSSSGRRVSTPTRERRAGLGRSRRRSLLVALIVARLRVRAPDYDFTTSGLIPTALRRLRRSRSASFAPLRLVHARAAAAAARPASGRSSLGERSEPGLASARCCSRRSGAGIAYDVRRRRSRPDAGQELLERDRADGRPDEIVLSEGGFDEAAVLEIVETAHRAGVKVRIAPKTTELLLQRGEYVPGQGVPLFELRPPVLAGTDWAVKKAFDLVVSFIVVAARAPALAPDRARDQARLARAGALSRPPHRRRRAGVRDAQVPHDGAGRGRAAGGARGAERGGRRALQDPRRPARDARRPRAPRGSRSTSCRRCSTSSRGEMSLVGPAAAAAARLRAARGVAPQALSTCCPG